MSEYAKPWTLEQRLDGYDIGDAEGCYFAELRSAESNEDTQEESAAMFAARAALIAAAPEMYEALRDGLAAFELFMKHANWAASALTADAIRGANEMPPKMRAILAKLENRKL